MLREHMLFAGFATALVCAAIVAGFLTLGSPSRQRLAAQDRSRVADLKAVAGEIHSLWKKGPPSALKDLASAPGARNLRVTDPVTGEPYEYTRREGTVYELCATFAAVDRAPGPNPSFWVHPKGRGCYTLDAANRPPE